jgi:choline dehydrogenase-like flavoprotein
MRRAVVVGSGAGGATVAKELQGRYEVTVLEGGKAFSPFRMPLERLERVRQAGLLFDEREIQMVFPAFRIRRARDGMILVNGAGLGGTTTLCTGNALRQDPHLRALGIDLDAEFEEVYREIPVTTVHQERWHRVTRRLFAIFEELGLEPQPMPKMGEYERCLHCGRCQLGCQQGVKWDSRRFLDTARARGAQVVTGCRVGRVATGDGRAAGVWARQGSRPRFFPADLVVLAAGGFGTPVILERSGIRCEPRLFVDPVLTVGGRSPASMQQSDITMPFYSDQQDFILSPYFDHVSYLFNREWRLRAGEIVSVMIKLADDSLGEVSEQGVEKVLTERDRRKLDEGAATCREILSRFGVRHEEMILGTIIAGHPGGALPLTIRDAASLHPARLPENLYVADGTLLPRSTGGPPILTLVALAKRISTLCQAGEGCS